MEYLSAKEASEKWGISQRRVNQFCKEGRIEGVERIGNAWAIPGNAKKPEDPRRQRKKKQAITPDIKENQKIGAVIAAAGIVDGQGLVSPFMKLGGTSIIRRMVLIFQQAHIFPIVVITGYQALEVEQHLVKYGVIFIRNENFKSSDKFESAKLGFHFLKDKCDKVFFTSVKVPLFTSETLKEMINADMQVTVPTFRGRSGHPILISRKVIEKITEYQGNDGLRGAISYSGYRREFLEVDDEGIILTTDSIDQLDERIMEHNEQNLHPFLRISVERGFVFFDGRAKLLLLMIRETKSVQNACIQIAMSRGKAWDIINQMEKELGFAVVNRRQGGSRGGKTELTSKGEKFLDLFQEYEDKVRKYASEQFRIMFQDFK